MYIGTMAMQRRHFPSPHPGLWFIGDRFRGFASTLTPGYIPAALRASISCNPQLLSKSRIVCLFGGILKTTIAQLQGCWQVGQVFSRCTSGYIGTAQGGYAMMRPQALFKAPPPGGKGEFRFRGSAGTSFPAGLCAIIGQAVSAGVWRGRIQVWRYARRC